MKNPDEAIERVLAGLRDAESPEGMERRILDAMQHGASEKRKRNPIWLTTPPEHDRCAEVGDRRGRCSRHRFSDLLDRLPEPSNRTRHRDGEEAGNAGKYTGS